jgi:hypothetical protein
VRKEVTVLKEKQKTEVLSQDSLLSQSFMSDLKCGETVRTPRGLDPSKPVLINLSNNVTLDYLDGVHLNHAHQLLEAKFPGDSSSPSVLSWVKTNPAVPTT